MASQSRVLKLWQRLENRPGGHWLFTRLVCWQAPYFASIKPRVHVLEAGRCEVGIRKRRAVTNHIGSVHAIAMCNMAELAGGLMTDATVTPAYRWIPKGMTVEYRAIAKTDLVARAYPPEASAAEGDYVVGVDVHDRDDQVVLHADITMWLSQPKSGRTRK
ncbi:hotdog fold domain-containing protein [Salinisphaera sp. S4-8]|uniref:hotdog fold domain-containing protein n=1 Tax=Salinisphaera sp. S4-8 TaxID=633357 RepID=UPI00333EB511